MINSIVEFFSYEFLIKAFIVGILLSLSSSLIGVSLVLRRNSMIGDGLSHVAFGAIALATVLGLTPLPFTICIVIIASFLILRINNNSKINSEALIAILSASSLAIGTFIISITKGVNIDINNYLFGSILSVSNSDLVLSILLTVIVLLLFFFSYNKIFAITFDEKFAKSIGINTDLYNILFSILCSIIIVLGMRILGSLLISSLIIFPSITSMQVCKRFKSVVIISVFVSLISFVIGIISSYSFELPTSSTIVIVNLLFLFFIKLVNSIK